MGIAYDTNEYDYMEDEAFVEDIFGFNQGFNFKTEDESYD